MHGPSSPVRVARSNETRRCADPHRHSGHWGETYFGHYDRIRLTARDERSATRDRRQQTGQTAREWKDHCARGEVRVRVRAAHRTRSSAASEGTLTPKPSACRLLHLGRTNQPANQTTLGGTFIALLDYETSGQVQCIAPLTNGHLVACHSLMNNKKMYASIACN